jgi:tetratricopeptide (TPR) repeat protein
VAQADAALAVRKSDPAATKLREDAQVKIDKLRDKEQRYQTAMKSGQTAFDRGDYTAAVAQADAALAVRKSDPAATKLREDAQVKIDELRDKEQRYQTAMKSGQTAFDRGDYTAAVAQAGAALAVRGTDQAATKLKKDAAAKKSQLDALDTLLVELCTELRESKPPWLNMQIPPSVRPITTDIDLNMIDQISNQIDGLERGYKEGGWLTLSNRAQYIKNLKQNLKNR